jgi:hypothetical protein
MIVLTAVHAHQDVLLKLSLKVLLTWKSMLTHVLIAALVLVHVQ